MSRGLSAGMLSAISAQVIRPVFLAELTFETSTLYLNSSSKSLSWNAQTWLGNGLMLAIDGIAEAMETQSFGWRVLLQGADSAVRSIALSDVNQSKKGKIYLGLLDSSEALIADPVQVAGGYFDFAELSDDGGSSVVSLQYESSLQGSRRINELRYTDHSQKALFPTDTGFRYAAAAEDWSGFWGKAAKVPRPQRKRSRRGRN